MDCSPPGYSDHGILQARILEWVAISFSRGSSRLRNRTWGSLSLSWGGSFLGLCLPSGQSSCFVSNPPPHLPFPPCLVCFGILRCTGTPQPRRVSKWRLLGGARLIIPSFLTPRSFSAHKDCLPSHKMGRGRDPEFLYSDRFVFILLFIFAMIITLRCFQETNKDWLFVNAKGWL